MTTKLTIVGPGGSLGKVSRSRAALATALEGAKEAGAEIELLDLRELALPMYDPDQIDATETATRLIEACYAADGMLWASPMYQGTISGAFKNALDWLPARRLRSSVSARQGHRAHKRSGRNAGTAGYQHDGVLRPSTPGVGCPVRRSGGVRPGSSTQTATYGTKASASSSTHSAKRSSV
jgi:NAD(P)H-dependent FMN reductase